jgi:hypothetical protein
MAGQGVVPRERDTRGVRCPQAAVPTLSCYNRVKLPPIVKRRELSLFSILSKRESILYIYL